MNSVLATSIVAVLVCAVGAKNIARTQSQINNRIFNGKDAEIEDVPYQVALEAHLQGYPPSYLCGGIIISSKVILTAAHCIYQYQYILNIIKIRAGSSQRGKGGVVQDIDKAFIHDGYNLISYPNDIALLVLNGTIKFSKKIKAVELPNDNKDIPVNTKAIISGWGWTNSKNISASILQIGDTWILDQDECSRRAKAFTEQEITSSMLCTEKRNDSAHGCRGDSGGPLVQDGVVYGVTSWGDTKCDDERNNLVVYTRVTAFRKWISDKVQL